TYSDAEEVLIRTMQLGGLRVDRYSLQQEIGHGGSGVAYKAWDHVAARPCCVKIFYPLRTTHDIAWQSVLRAFRGLSRLSTSNIIRVQNLGSTVLRGCQYYYLAMELVRGQNLRDWARQRLSFSGSECTRAKLQVAMSVARAPDIAHHVQYLDSV